MRAVGVVAEDLFAVGDLPAGDAVERGERAALVRRIQTWIIGDMVPSTSGGVHGVPTGLRPATFGATGSSVKHRSPCTCHCIRRAAEVGHVVEVRCRSAS